jgi:hypothetical protein
MDVSTASTVIVDPGAEEDNGNEGNEGNGSETREEDNGNETKAVRGAGRTAVAAGSTAAGATRFALLQLHILY